MTTLSAVEFQADEMRTIVGGKGPPIWVFAVIDVCSRPWPSTVVGKRSYRKTLDLLRDLSNRMSLEAQALTLRTGLQRAGGIGENVANGFAQVWESCYYDQSNENQQERVLDQILTFFLLNKPLD